MHLPIGSPCPATILLESGQGVTLGGEILDVDPVVPASRAKPDRDVERGSVNGPVDVDHLRRLTGELERPTSAGGRSIPPPWAPPSTNSARPWRTQGISDSRLLHSTSSSEPCSRRSTTSPSMGHGPGPARPTSWPTAIWSPGSKPIRLRRRSSTTPTRPRFANSPPRRACGEGGVVFAASAIDEAARVVARLLADQPDGITVAEARDAWGTARKFAIPLITRLDETA